MDNFIKKFNSQFFIRCGLGLMFVYVGYRTIVQPTLRVNILSALNGLLKKYDLITLDNNLLLIIGIFEVVIGVFFLLWFLPKRTVFWAALGGAIEIALILFLLGLSVSTFTYIGLFGALVSTVVAYNRKY